jgi:hypothetical protein
MKGQYFSFDAIVAAIIVVLAFSMFASYWFSMQQITESRSNDMRLEAMRVAESMISPGSPQNWASGGPSNVRQIGLTQNFTNAINKSKVDVFFGWSNPGQVDSMRRILQLPSSYNYTVVITQSDEPGTTGYNKIIGNLPPASAMEVASAYRGATIDGHPCSVRVILYR